MTLKKARENIGKEVVYIPFNDCAPEDLEPGVITSVNHIHVFVKYEGDLISKATRPRDLKFKEEMKNESNR